MGIITSVASAFDSVYEFVSVLFANTPMISFLIKDLCIAIIGVAAWRIVV